MDSVKASETQFYHDGDEVNSDLCSQLASSPSGAGQCLSSRSTGAHAKQYIVHVHLAERSVNPSTFHGRSTGGQLSTQPEKPAWDVPKLERLPQRGRLGLSTLIQAIV